MSKKMRPMSALHHGNVAKGRADKDRLPNVHDRPGTSSGGNMDSNYGSSGNIPPLKPIAVNIV